MSPFVRVEVQDRRSVVTLDRPERRNALTEAMMRDLATTVAGADPDECDLVLLRGQGPIFCAGADLEAAAGLRSAEGAERLVDAAAGLVEAVRTQNLPVVVDTRGAAVGLAVAIVAVADLAYADTDTWLALPHTEVGLVPDGGATALVAAAVGRPRAMRMALLGERVWARRAVQDGLLADAFAPEEYDAQLNRVLTRLQVRSGRALRATKRAVDTATLAHLPFAMNREREAQRDLFVSGEFARALAARQRRE